MFIVYVVIAMRRRFLWESAVQSCNDITNQKITRRGTYKAEG